METGYIYTHIIVWMFFHTSFARQCDGIRLGVSSDILVHLASASNIWSMYMYTVYCTLYIYIICLPFIGDLAVYLSGRYKTLVYEHSNFNTFNGGLFLCCPRKAYLLSGETHDLLRRGARLVGKHRTLAFCEAMVSWHWLTGCRLQTPKPWKKTQFFMVCRKICRYMICVCVYICIYKSMHRYFIDWESYLYCSRSSCFRDWGPNKTCETSNFMNVSSQKLQRL